MSNRPSVPRQSEDRRKAKVVRRVLLTDVLTPYPLFPALAIRRRYFLLRQTGYVKRAQTIKCNRHSGGEKEKRGVEERREKSEIEIHTLKRPSRRGSLAAHPGISHNVRRGLLC